MQNLEKKRMKIFSQQSSIERKKEGLESWNMTRNNVLKIVLKKENRGKKR